MKEDTQALVLVPKCHACNVTLPLLTIAFALSETVFAHFQAAMTMTPNEESAPKLLGEGSCGTVLLGRDLTRGDEVAIKVEAAREDGESLLEREHQIMRQLRGLTGFSEPRYLAVYPLVPS